MSVDLHLKALGLSKQHLGNHCEQKKAFTAKIRACQNSQQRSAYTLAYEVLTKTKISLQSQSHSQTLILEAIYKGDIKFLQNKFLEDPNLVNFRKKQSNYPLLYLATRSGNYEVVELILKHGCSLDFSADRSSPMHCASYYGHQNLISLLSQYGIPTHIKNFCNNLPSDEACNSTIEKLLKDSSEDQFHKLVEKLIDAKKALGTLNLSFSEPEQITIKQKNNQKQRNNQKKKNEQIDFFVQFPFLNNYRKVGKDAFDVRKILLRGYFDDQYESWEDTFHGTSYNVLDSIAINGLHGVGQKVGGKTLTVVEGHISQRVQKSGQDDWAKAIFVSPSIYYAGNYVYSKKMEIGGINYCPIVQVKVKPKSYYEYNHTLKIYKHKKNEPIKVEYRIQCDDQEDKDEQVHTSPQNKNVKVVAIMLVRQAFLEENCDYNSVTSLVLNSEQENNFRRHGKMNILNQ